VFFLAENIHDYLQDFPIYIILGSENDFINEMSEKNAPYQTKGNSAMTGDLKQA